MCLYVCGYTYPTQLCGGQRRTVSVDSLRALRGAQELELKLSGWALETFMQGIILLAPKYSLKNTPGKVGIWQGLYLYK